MHVLSADRRRVTETPNAVMTTLASPSLGGSATSVWLVEMRPGAEGPEHAFDSDVVWTLTDGDGVLRHGGSERAVAAGDTLLLPAHEMRQLVGGVDGFRAVVVAGGASAVTRADGAEGGVPPWVS